MSLRTFLGPLLAGTNKNNNANYVTANTPSPSYLILPGSANSNVGGYRNTGAVGAYQTITLSATTLTNIAAASFPYTFYPTYTVQGVNYPIVIPAGSYIDNIDFNVVTTFTFSGAPTSLAVAVNLIGAPGTTYATAQTIATATLTAASLPPVGSYPVTNASTASQYAPFVSNNSATPVAMSLNTGTSDCMLQLVLTFTGGTTPAISTGSFGLMFSYILRAPDGSWYPQTPTSPVSNPPVQTY
jgi:hypothetical protein